MRVRTAAGIREAGESEKKATPDGSDNTPAPMILFAKLKMEEDVVALPPRTLSDDAAATTRSAVSMLETASTLARANRDEAELFDDATASTETKINVFKSFSILITIG